MARTVQHQAVSHTIEQVSPQLRPGGSSEDDSMLQPRQHIVVDPVSPARIPRLLGRVHPDAGLPSDDHVGEDRVVTAMLAYDSRGAGADDGIATQRAAAGVIQPEADSRTIRSILPHP